MEPKYMKIIHLIAKKSIVNLDICRIFCPEISSGTFHSTLSKLVKHGLVKKDSKDSQLTTYTKTNEFTIEKAVEAVRTKYTFSLKQEKIRPFEDYIQKVINSIVDPATGLTFADMKITVNARELTPGFVHIEFFPSFCPLAAEFTMYIKNALKQIPSIEQASIRCNGQACNDKNNRQTRINQSRSTSPKGLLEYLK
ncbi:MAG: hypothetical protein QXX08_11325 [Candidatus Bathyarchaeia archaeon]